MLRNFGKMGSTFTPPTATTKIRSCFGSGFWINEKPWFNDESWKNNFRLNSFLLI